MSILPGLPRWALVALFAYGLSILAPIRVQAQQPPSVPPGPDLEQRVRELEETVRQLQAERNQRVAQPAPNGSPTQAAPGATPANPESSGPGQTPGEPGSTLGTMTSGGGSSSADSKPSILAGWDDKRGFFLRSSDDQFNLRLTGQIQADYRAFLDGRDYTDIDSFLIRRARLGIEADVFKYYEFRLLPDFSNAQGPGIILPLTRIQDSYINVHYWDAFQFEAGKFKQPFSYEQLIQDRFVPTMERSIIDQLVPARDEGLMIHGRDLFDKRLDYAASVSNGEINGDFDTNKLKDVVGRLVIRPWNDADFWPYLHGLQFGISVTTGKEQEAVSPAILRTPATVPWLTFNATVREDGIRNRWSPEVVYFYGPLGLAAQYFHQDEQLRPTFAGAGSQYLLDVPFNGYYVMGTYLITGEERTTYSMPIAPKHPFDPCHPCIGTGAWELVARVSELNVGDEVFERLPTSRTTFTQLVNPAFNANRATEMTLGFNWYLNKFVRTQLNWERAWFNNPVRLGPTPNGILTHQDTVYARFQVIF
jgi:phosphate-selective porin OprO/OprP